MTPQILNIATYRWDGWTLEPSCDQKINPTQRKTEGENSVESNMAVHTHAFEALSM